jgi:hypothetical protein
LLTAWFRSKIWGYFQATSFSMVMKFCVIWAAKLASW